MKHVVFGIAFFRTYQIYYVNLETMGGIKMFINVRNVLGVQVGN